MEDLIKSNNSEETIGLNYFEKMYGTKYDTYKDKKYNEKNLQTNLGAMGVDISNKNNTN